MIVSNETTWINENENSNDASLSMSACIMAFTMALNDFASAQGTEISELNNQVSTLSTAINLLRTYTPQGFSSGTTPNTINLSSVPWSSGNADADLYTIMQALNSNGLNTSTNYFVSPGSTSLLPASQINWSTAVSTYSADFNQAGMNTWGQSLQASSTQLTTDVQTMTAQASQTTQMSNTMSQAASSVLANMLQMYLAGAKA
jgi:hypothetical protein